MKKWTIAGATVLTPQRIIEKGHVLVENGMITSVSDREKDASFSLKVDKCIVVPGLINSHDHLLGNYYPKVGNGPYINWLPWDNDLKSSPLYQERQQIENRDLYLLGSYRNLVSGVTTVSDHMPHFVAEPFYDLLPVKAIRRYALAHSVGVAALNWGDTIPEEYEKAKRDDIPFITHISEGFDDETVGNLQTLNRLGGLGPNSVLVHGIAFSEKDMDLIKSKDASVVWCADSNMFMFNHTTNIELLLKKGINVCIGTDSPMSGGLNLLHEMRFDRAYYKKQCGKELSDRELLRMVTTNPAKAFRLKKSGAVAEGYTADLTIFRDRGGSPENSVVDAELRDVMLVVIDGKPMYGDRKYEDLFRALKVDYQEIVLDGVEKVIAGDLLGLLWRISKAVGFKKEFPFLPVEFDF